MRSIAIASTFTAEPVEAPLAFWMDELGQTASIEFAAYNQVFQQLLDPSSLLGMNRQGVNIVLIRVEDWQRFHRRANNQQGLGPFLQESTTDLINAVGTAIARSTTPLFVALCPNAPSALTDPYACTLFAEVEQRIVAALDQVPNLYLVGPDEFSTYPVDMTYDPQRDQLGHIPYTSLFYAALATILARRIHALTSLPYKVIVLDCDNTIWGGVVGEDGVEGISLSAAWKRMQQSMVELSGKGFVLCLCSKNDEGDVLDVFDKRTDMILKREHLVSWRINWERKSENIRSLACELKLGLDSFIFLDDNPIECAEVRAGCPEVLTLQLPKEEDIGRFLGHVWAFDRLKVTSEDQQRTLLYKQEIDRARFRTQALSIETFLEGLNLEVKLSEPTPVQLPRLAQLTQRTNQFNFTAVRRTEAELERLLRAGMECRVVEVSDRFGDYGLVGGMVCRASRDVLEVDTFLLSCRVLNRGVEHRMLNEMGRIALERDLPTVVATVVTTKKNQPARDFLESVAAQFREETEGGCRYLIPAAVAAEVVLSHGPVQLEPESEVEFQQSRVPPTQTGVSGRYERIASELFSADQVVGAVESRSNRARPRPKLSRSLTAPQTEIERLLTELWSKLLRIEPVGIHDDFFELGGTSLQAVDLFAHISRHFGQHLPLTSLIEAPTVERLAQILTGTSGRDSIVLIREGGDKPPVFLIHDGDGETMLYRNLAMLLKNDHAVYGLQPHACRNVPLAQTRISAMATHHIEKMRSIQPYGPYLVGGMCAGGVIAYEVARQLQGSGETVAMVALLDAADVAAPPRVWRFVEQRVHSFSKIFHQGESAGFHRSSLMIFSKALRKARNLATYAFGQRLRNLRDEVRMRLFSFYLDRGLRLPRVLEQIPVRTTYLFAEKHYRPEGVFHGDLLLFRATSGVGADEPYVERYADPLLGWGRRTSGQVNTFDVPGGHSSMLQEPHVRVLAEYMQGYIDSALSGEGQETAGQLALVRAVN